MASLNQATIIGYVGDAPKIANTQNGRKVASFAVATTEKGYFYWPWKSQLLLPALEKPAPNI